MYILDCKPHFIPSGLSSSQPQCVLRNNNKITTCQHSYRGITFIRNYNDEVVFVGATSGSMGLCHTSRFSPVN